MLITDRHLYKLDPLKQYKPMKTLPLYNVGDFAGLTAFAFADAVLIKTEGSPLDTSVEAVYDAAAGGAEAALPSEHL